MISLNNTSRNSKQFKTTSLLFLNQLHLHEHTQERKRHKTTQEKEKLK